MSAFTMQINVTGTCNTVWKPVMFSCVCVSEISVQEMYFIMLFFKQYFSPVFAWFSYNKWLLI